MLMTQTEQQTASATQPIAPRFSLADADRAYDEWGANCGPGALAAIMKMTLDEVRPYLVGFDAKHYTNPTMMMGRSRAFALAGTPTRNYSPPVERHGTGHATGCVASNGKGHGRSPACRCAPIPLHALEGSYAANNENVGVFDVNCMNNGSGWCSLKNWSDVIAPHLIAQYKRASGGWHLTHAIEIEEPTTGRP